MARIAASINQWRVRSPSRAQAQAQVAKSGAKEVPYCCGNFRGMGLQREVSGVEETHDRIGNIAFEPLGTLRQEERIVLAPHGQEKRLSGGGSPAEDLREGGTPLFNAE